MAVGALPVPVLRGAGPVQTVTWLQLLVHVRRIDNEPFVPLGIPGHGQTLHPANLVILGIIRAVKLH